MQENTRDLIAVRYGMPSAIVAAVLLGLLPVLRNDFVNWDDPYYFTSNPSYRGLSLSHLRWMFTTVYMSHYQPLFWVVHDLVRSVGGLNPSYYHGTSLLLHAASTVLFYYLTVALLRRVDVPASAKDEGAVRLGAAAAALFFGIHPLRVEAVAWGVELGEILGGFFYLLTILTYLEARDAQRPDPSRRRWYAVSLGCFALCLLSKATTMMLPIALLALDIYPLRRFAHTETRQLIPALAEKIPYAAFAFAAAAMALHAKHSAGMASMKGHGLVERVMQAAYGLCFYLWKTVVPFRLSPLYLLEEPLDPAQPKYVLCLLCVAGIMTAVLLLRRRCPWLFAAWACYVIMLSPVLGLVQAGPQLVADRYTYVSCLPWAVVGGAAVYRLLRAWEERRLRMIQASAAVAVLAIVLAVLGMRSHEQARVWEDSLTLWSHVLHLDPTNYLAYNSRGDARLVPVASQSACHVQGDLAAAIADYSAAVRLAPPGARYRSTFETNLALARQQLLVCNPRR